MTSFSPHSALAVRETPGQENSYDVLFQLGSQANFATTTSTASLASDIGVSGTLAGDAIHMLTITDDGVNVTGSQLRQVATGLRNPAGLAFHPATGDLYLQDNGIDGFVDSNEPESADELNIIPAADLGVTIADFGFPSSYTQYRTGRSIGGEGIQPLVAFQPIPDPAAGDEGEGPNDVVFAPENNVWLNFGGLGKDQVPPLPGSNRESALNCSFMFIYSPKNQPDVIKSTRAPARIIFQSGLFARCRMHCWASQQWHPRARDFKLAGWRAGG